MTAYEIRTMDLADARAEVAEDGRSFRGHAAVYKRRTAIGDPRTWGFFEELDDHAAKATTDRGDDIRFLIEHTPRLIVARTAAGTLEVADDSPRGWASYIPVLDTELTYVRDMVTNLRNKNLTAMSFGFRVPLEGDTWTEIKAQDDEGEYTAMLRQVHTFDGFDQSVVAYPAYVDTDAALRSAALALAETADKELIAHKLEIAPELGPALADVADHAIRSEPHNADTRKRNKDTLRAVLAALAHQHDAWAVYIVRGAIAPHSTAVVDEPWDRPAVIAASASAATLRHISAWVDGNGDPDAAKYYMFRHHAPQLGSPANLQAVNDALDFLARASIPPAEAAKVRRHLKRHLADWKTQQGDQGE